MRVASLASIIAFMAGTPVFAQCVYVACSNGGQSGPVYQQPSYQPPALQGPQAPMPAPRAAQGSYDEGFAAGMAAVRPVSPRATPRPTRRVTAARPAQRTVTRTTARQSGARIGFNASNIYGRSSSGGARSAATPTITRRHVAAQRPAAARHTQVVRRTPARASHTHSATAAHLASRHRIYTSSNGGTYQDPIKDRAATYRPSTYGQSTTMASMMSRSSSYSQSSTTWSGPASTVNQGGQVCGWGARIVTNGYGPAQRHAVWVCQCPQGWRPPGY